MYHYYQLGFALVQWLLPVNDELCPESCESTVSVTQLTGSKWMDFWEVNVDFWEADKFENNPCQFLSVVVSIYLDILLMVV